MFDDDKNALNGMEQCRLVQVRVGRLRPAGNETVGRAASFARCLKRAFSLNGNFFLAKAVVVELAYAVVA